MNNNIYEIQSKLLDKLSDDEKKIWYQKGCWNENCLGDCDDKLCLKHLEKMNLDEKKPSCDGSNS